MESEKDRQMEDKSKGVPSRAKQFEEAAAMRPIAEPCVWTDQMLKALARGVKGGKWYSVIDKVWKPKTLRRAFELVKQNGGAAGVDEQTIEDFERHHDANIERISRNIREETYEPKAVKRTWIPKPGGAEERPLGIPTIEDRVIQMACKIVLEPIFEKDFAEHSYGFRPKRSAKDALRHFDGLLQEGAVWVVDADIKSYFDEIPHRQLMERVSERVSDGRMLKLVETFLDQEVVDGDDRWKPEKGTPQGGVISPLLANIYLNPLDHHMAEQGYEMIRYADDFVVVCDTEEEAKEALHVIETWVNGAELRLHPEKTKLVDASGNEGVHFLGYAFKNGVKVPRKKARKRFKEKIRAKTRRTEGHSLETVIEEVNEVTESWFEYFKHSCAPGLTSLDGWIRNRLRAVLKQRAGNPGHPGPADYKRWPNSFFAKCGLSTMAGLRAAIHRSLF